MFPEKHCSGSQQSLKQSDSCVILRGLQLLCHCWKSTHQVLVPGWQQNLQGERTCIKVKLWIGFSVIGESGCWPSELWEVGTLWFCWDSRISPHPSVFPWAGSVRGHQKLVVFSAQVGAWLLGLHSIMPVFFSSHICWKTKKKKAAVI